MDKKDQSAEQPSNVQCIIRQNQDIQPNSSIVVYSDSAFRSFRMSNLSIVEIVFFSKTYSSNRNADQNSSHRPPDR